MVKAAWECLRWLVKQQATEMKPSKKAVGSKVEEKSDLMIQLKT